MKIYLREVELTDGSMLVKWRNSPNTLKHCLTGNKITIESNERFFHDNIETGKYKQYIVERIEEEFNVCSYPIATVYLKDLDLVNKKCELCIFTSDDGEWNDEGKSIAIQMLLKKASNDFGLRKVYSYVFSEFLEESKLLRDAGFHAECILADEIMGENGEYRDLIRFCVFI